jgi:tRNA(fMet)-specific endonuclease VapC
VKVLLDTNAYSALRQGHELVSRQVRTSEEVLLPIVVVGELLFGFRNGSRDEENARALGSFLGDRTT